MKIFFLQVVQNFSAIDDAIKKVFLMDGGEEKIAYCSDVVGGFFECYYQPAFALAEQYGAEKYAFNTIKNLMEMNADRVATVFQAVHDKYPRIIENVFSVVCRGGDKELLEKVLKGFALQKLSDDQVSYLKRQISNNFKSEDCLDLIRLVDEERKAVEVEKSEKDQDKPKEAIELSGAASLQCSNQSKTCVTL